MYALQSILWPSAAVVGASEAMYLRAHPRQAWTFGPGGGAKAGPVPESSEFFLDLGTFFGAFSLNTWCVGVGLESVTLEIECRGRATLRIYQDSGYEGRSLLMQKRIAGDGKKQYIEVGELKGARGILFPEFVLGPGDRFELLSVNYLTHVPPKHSPRLAIVMPTYQREKDVARNVARIAAGVLKDHPEVRMFVVDNGRSLDVLPTPGVEVIQNPNFGGAGGFARGLLEVRKAGGFTHVMFCDDDVLISPHSILRLLALLGYVGDDTAVAGGMLKMHAKHIYVRSPEVHGIRFSALKRDQDLTDPATVCRYDQPSYSAFSGWWLACYPLTGKLKDFMPLPFFVGWDDIEFGRRLNKLGLRTVTLLGFVIWHEDFDKKDNQWRGYYHARNGTITAMLYEPGPLALKQVWGEIMLDLMTYRYDRAEFMIDGLDWLSRGPDALGEQGPDELHRSLVQRPQVRLADVSSVLVPARLREGPGMPTVSITPGAKVNMGMVMSSVAANLGLKVRRFYAKLTFNGHLLPLSFFKSARDPSFPGWLVEPLHSRSVARLFRHRRVIYYEATTGRGLDCQIDHRRFWRLFLRLVLRRIDLRLRWRFVRDAWRAEHARLTSPEFWREYLGLPKA